MILIPLRAKPNQTFGIMLNGQSCEMNIFQKTTGLYFSLYVNGVPIVLTRLIRHGVPLVRQNYHNFIGDLIMIDSQGTTDPDYTGLDSRYQFYYITAKDFA